MSDSIRSTPGEKAREFWNEQARRFEDNWPMIAELMRDRGQSAWLASECDRLNALLSERGNNLAARILDRLERELGSNHAEVLAFAEEVPSCDLYYKFPNAAPQAVLTGSEAPHMPLTGQAASSQRPTAEPAAAAPNPNDGEFGLPVEHRQFDKQETPRSDAFWKPSTINGVTAYSNVVVQAAVDFTRKLERELADCLQQYERVKVERNGAIDRAQLCLDAKDNWADRAKAAEAALSARGDSAELVKLHTFVAAFKAAYPDIRQLQDGFVSDESWSVWDEAVRQKTIDLGNMVFDDMLSRSVTEKK